MTAHSSDDNVGRFIGGYERSRLGKLPRWTKSLIIELCDKLAVAPAPPLPEEVVRGLVRALKPFALAAERIEQFGDPQPVDKLYAINAEDVQFELYVADQDRGNEIDIPLVVEDLFRALAAARAAGYGEEKP